MRGWGRGRKPPFWVYLRSAFRRGRETLEGVSRTVVESPKSGEGCRGKNGWKMQLETLASRCPTFQLGQKSLALPGRARWSVPDRHRACSSAAQAGVREVEQPRESPRLRLGRRRTAELEKVESLGFLLHGHNWILFCFVFVFLSAS